MCLSAWVATNPLQAFIQAILFTVVLPERYTFFYCLLSLVALLHGPMVDTKVKVFKI